MKKQLLLAVVAVAGLSLMPEAEARRGRCGRSCAPAQRECPQACTVKDVGEKYIPCCRMVKEEGYQVCPIEEKCCRRVRCCKERTSCCIFPGDRNFSQDKLEQAHGRTDTDTDMVPLSDIVE